MLYQTQIESFIDDPARLEDLYRSAIKDQQVSQFETELLACYRANPDNKLLSAWYYRLQTVNAAVQPKRRPVAWLMAAGFAVLNGLLFWFFSDYRFVLGQKYTQIPYLLLLWSPFVALLTITFLALTRRQAGITTSRPSWLWISSGGLVLATAWAFIFYSDDTTITTQFGPLMALHLPLLAWAAVGISILGLSNRPFERFCFLIKSIEVFVVAGLFLIAGVIFGGITLGLFSAISVQLPEEVMQFLGFFGIGLIPLLAVAAGYDPTRLPSEQDFSQGLGKLIALLPRLLLPLTLLVLVVYICFIPFYFTRPYFDRDVLIIYNIMLFAVMGLLVGATPLKQDEMAPRWMNLLRSGILLVAGLVVLVSLYALSATVYRTILGGITMNRLAILGWNTLNITLLVLLLVKGLQAGRENWVKNLHVVFSLACAGYVSWSLVLMVVTGIFW